MQNKVFNACSWNGANTDNVFLGTSPSDSIHMVWRNEGSNMPVLHSRFKPSDTTFYAQDTVYRAGISGDATGYGFMRVVFDTSSYDTFYVVFKDEFSILHCLRTRNRGLNWTCMKSKDPEAFRTIAKYRPSTPFTVCARNDSVPVSWYELVDSTIHVMVFTDTVPNFTWIGQGYDNNWSNVKNWHGGVVPGVNDTAIFDGTCSRNCTFNQNVSVKGFRMTGYQGTITQGAYTLTVGTGNFVQSSGTLTASSKRFHCQGDFTLTGGTFTPPATDSFFFEGAIFSATAGKFTKNASKFYIPSGSPSITMTNDTIGTMILNTAGSITINGTVKVGDSLIITDINDMIGGTITVAKDLIYRETATSTARTTAFTMNGTGIQNLRQAVNAVWPTGTFEINKPSGKVVLGSDVGLSTSGLTITSGTLDQGASYNLVTGGA
ncbi:MAG: hypothetical protein JNL74_24355, partial [Fibrobacteres bacterium]|nr:hypothetical protein [Fibrobacterota bacterium]